MGGVSRMKSLIAAMIALVLATASAAYGQDAARYFAFHSPRQIFPYSEQIEDLARDQIEYFQEDASIRQRFEGELSKRGLASTMPDEAYVTRDYQWEYTED